MSVIDNDRPAGQRPRVIKLSLSDTIRQSGIGTAVRRDRTLRMRHADLELVRRNIKPEQKIRLLEGLIESKVRRAVRTLAVDARAREATVIARPRKTANSASPGGSRLRRRFVRLRQYSGRVREVDSDAGTFYALLHDPARPHDPLSATFRTADLSDRDQARMRVGAAFHWIIGRRETTSERTGRVLRRSTESLFLFRNPRVPSQAEIEEARRAARAALDRHLP